MIPARPETCLRCGGLYEVFTGEDDGYCGNYCRNRPVPVCMFCGCDEEKVYMPKRGLVWTCPECSADPADDVPQRR